MVNTNIQVPVILRHYFKLDLKAAEAVHRIWETERNETIYNHTD